MFNSTTTSLTYCSLVVSIKTIKLFMFLAFNGIFVMINIYYKALYSSNSELTLIALLVSMFNYAP